MVGRHEKRKRRQDDFYLVETRESLKFRIGAKLVSLGFAKAGKKPKQMSYFRVTLSEAQLDAIGAIYAESNRRTKERFGLPLGRDGYSL